MDETTTRTNTTANMTKASGASATSGSFSNSKLAYRVNELVQAELERAGKAAVAAGKRVASGDDDNEPLADTTNVSGGVMIVAGGSAAPSSASYLQLDVIKEEEEAADPMHRKTETGEEGDDDDESSSAEKPGAAEKVAASITNKPRGSIISHRHHAGGRSMSTASSLSSSCSSRGDSSFSGSSVADDGGNEQDYGGGGGGSGDDDALDDDKATHISFELRSDYSWSDYSFDLAGGDCLGSDVSGSYCDPKFKDSIDAIREEASRVDAVMAMDKLDSLRLELDSVKRKLKSQKAELAEQRALCKLKDDRMATLELERDLYKADAGKLKSDMEALQAEKESASQVGGNGVVDQRPFFEEEKKDDFSPVAYPRSLLSLPPPPPPPPLPLPSSPLPLPSSPLPPANFQGAGEETSGDADDNKCSDVKEDRKLLLAPRSPPEAAHQRGTSQRSRLERPARAGGRGGAANRSIRSRHNHCRSVESLSAQYLNTAMDTGTFLSPPKELASFLVSRKAKDASEARFDKTMSRLSLRRIVAGPKQQQHHRSNNSATTASSSCYSKRRYATPGEVELTTAWPAVSLEDRVEDLQQRLKTSTMAAEELKRRLATVTRYYESVIRKLHARMEETKAQKAQMEVDLVHQITLGEASKQRAIRHLEAMLREKEREIQRFRCEI